MSKKRYRPLDDFNESNMDTEVDQLQNLDFNTPTRKKRREVTPERVAETPEGAAALQQLMSIKRSDAMASSAFGDPNNPLISDEYYTSGGSVYKPLEEPGDFENFWDLTFGTAQDIHSDAIRGHMFRTEAEIDAILNTAETDEEREELLKSERVLELLEENKDYEEDLLEEIESAERNKQSVSELYYAKAAAGQKEENTDVLDYIGTAEMAQDLGGALSDIKYMTAGIAASSLAASSPAVAASVTGTMSWTGPVIAPILGAIAGLGTFALGTAGAVGSGIEMRSNESAAEMYSSYKERYNTLVENATEENNGEQLSEDQLIVLERMAKDGAEEMYQQDMALVGSDMAQIAIAAIPWSSYLRLGRIPFRMKKWSDKAKAVAKFGTIIGAEAALEGHEESYQYITKEQYKLGMYDDYDETDFPFLRAMVNAPHIGKEAAIGMVDMYSHRSANGLTNTEEFRNSTRAGMALGFGMGGFMSATIQPFSNKMTDKANRMTLGTELEELGASFGNSSWEENLDIEQVSQKVNGLAKSLEKNRGANILKAARLFQEDQEKAGNPDNIDFDKLRKSIKSTIDVYNMHKKANPSLSNKDLINITKGHEYLNHYIEKAENNIETFTEQQLKQQQSEDFKNSFSGQSTNLETAHNLVLEIQAVEELLANTKAVEKEAKKLGRFSAKDLERLMLDNNTEKLNEILSTKKEFLKNQIKNFEDVTEEALSAIGTGADGKITEAVKNKIGAEISLEFLKELRAPLANPKKSGDILNNPFVRDVAKNEENGEKARKDSDSNRKKTEESVETDESEVQEGDKAWFQGFPFKYMGRAGENYLLKPLSKTGGAIIEVTKDIFAGLRKLVSIPKTKSEINETVNKQRNDPADNSNTKKGKESSEEYDERVNKNQAATEQTELQAEPGTEAVVKPGEQFTLFSQSQIDEGYRDFANLSIAKDDFSSPLYRFFHERSKEQVEALEVTYEVERESIPQGSTLRKLWANNSKRSAIIKYLKDNREKAIELLDSQEGIKIKVTVKDLADNKSESTSLIGINRTSTNEEIDNIIDTFGSILQLTPLKIAEATPIKGKIIHTNYGIFNNIKVQEGDKEVPIKNSVNTLKDEGANKEILFGWQNADKQVLLGEGQDIRATLDNEGRAGAIYALYRHVTEDQKVIGTPLMLNKRNITEEESSVVFDIYKKLLFSKIETDSKFTFNSDYNATGFENLSASQVLNFILEKTIGSGFNRAKNILKGAETVAIDKERLDSNTRKGIKFETGKNSRLVFGDNFMSRSITELYDSETNKITYYGKTGSNWTRTTFDLIPGEERRVENESSRTTLSEQQGFEEIERAFNIFTGINTKHQVVGTILNDSIFSLKGFSLKDSIKYFGRTIKKGTESAVYSDMMIQGKNPVLTTDVEKIGVKGKQKVQKNRQVVVSPTDITTEKEDVIVTPDPKAKVEKSIATTAPTTENLNKPFVTVRDGSGKMVSVSTETTEKDGVKKTKFKSETTTKEGKPITQKNKSYNTFEELVEDIGIDLNTEENESALELVEVVKETHGSGVSVKVLEIREDTNKSSAFYGTRSATIRIGSENIEILLKSQPTQQTSGVSLNKQSSLGNVVSSWLQTKEGSLDNQTAEESASKFALIYNRKNPVTAGDNRSVAQIVEDNKKLTPGQRKDNAGQVGVDLFNTIAQGMNVRETILNEIKSQVALGPTPQTSEVEAQVDPDAVIQKKGEIDQNDFDIFMGDPGGKPMVITLLNETEKELPLISIEEARAYLDKVLGSAVPVHVKEGLLRVGKKGTKAYGIFVDGAIILSKMGRASVEYHEAYHAVEDLYLEPQQIEGLNKETVQTYGEPSQDSISVIMEDRGINAKAARQYLLSEFRAEEFRAYELEMLDMSTLSTKLKFFYNTLKDHIMQIFKGPSSRLLYRSISKGTYAKQKTDITLYRVEDSEISLDEQTQALEDFGINEVDRFNITKSLLQDYITRSLNVINQKEDKKLVSIRDIADLEKFFSRDMFLAILNAHTQKVELTEDQKNNLDVIKENFDVFVSEDLTGLIPEFLNSLSVTFNTEEEYKDTVDSNDDLKSIKAPYEFNSLDSATVTTKLLFQLLPNKDESNNIILDEKTGLPSIANGNFVYTQMQKVLANIDHIYNKEGVFVPGIAQMKTKLNLMSTSIPVFKGFATDVLENLTEQQQSQFYKVMNMKDYNFTSLLEYVYTGVKMKEGEGLVPYSTKTINTVDAAQQSLEYRLVTKWFENYKRAFFKFGDNNEIIVKNKKLLTSVLNDFVNYIQVEKNKLKTDEDISVFLGELSSLLTKIGIDISKSALIKYAYSYEEGAFQAITDLLKGKGGKPGVQYLFVKGTGGKDYKYSIRDILNNIDENNVVTNDFNLDKNNTIKDYSYALKTLGAIAAFSEENLTGSTVNVGGKSYWTFSAPNFLFNSVDRITASTKELSNLVQDRWAKGSKYLENAKNLKILTFAEWRNTDSGKAGKTYTDLMDREYMSSSINKMFATKEGIVNFPTFADKSTWYMLQGAEIFIDQFKGDFIKYDKEADIVKINQTTNAAKEISNLFAGYVIEEVERIAQVEDDLNTLDDTQLTETFHYTRDNEDGTHDRTSARGLKILLFKSLNNDEILREVGLKNEDNTWAINKNIADIKTKLQPYILEVLEERIRVDLESSVQNNIVNKNEGAAYTYLNAKISPLDSALKKTFSIPEKLIAAFSVNSLIANVEATKMFSGDPAYYKNDEDLTKRIVSIIAPGSSLNLLKESFYRAAVVKDFELNSVELIKNYSEFLKGQGYTNAEIKRMLKAYTEVNVTDGQAYITLERWRDLMIDLGDIDRAVIEEAYERLNDPKGKPTEEDVRLVMAQPLKGMLFSKRDSEVHGKKEQIPTYLKYSQAVLIPAFVENKADIGEVLKAIKRDKIDELIFESGIKSGALSPTTIVDKQGKLLKAEDISFNVMTLNNRDWKLQQPLSPHKTSEQLEGSQPKKNILSNVKLLEDYVIPMTFRGKKGKWESSTKTVKGYELVEEFHAIDRALSDIEFESLSEEWGIEGDIYSGYTIKDIESLKASLEKDFLKDDAVADKIIQLLALQNRTEGDTTVKEFILSFDNNPFDDVIERKLASIITKKLVKLNMPGGSFIQTSNFGMSKPKRFTDLTKSEQDDLRGQMFPEEGLNAAMWDEKTGKAKGAQIFLPNYMKKLIPNNIFNDKTELKKYLQDNRLLEAVGYRIPNQGIASIDALEVVGFLPQAYGDTVIAYDEITAKTGSDFDIDKMYIMLPSFSYVYEKDENGKNTDKVKGVKYINFDSSKSDALENIQENLGSANSKKALRNRKLELYRALIQDKNTFADLINPLDSVDVKDNSMFVRYLESKNNISEEDIETISGMYSVNEEGNYKFEDDFYKTVAGVLDKTKADLNWYTFSTQMEIRRIYLGGKFGVGQEARHITDHSISQHSPSWKRNSLESPYYLAGIDFGIGNVTPEGSSDLSQVRIRNSKVSIASLLSARLDGYVDIAKDPYIFYINNNYLTANTVALMDRLGTDPQWTDMFMSLPIIKEYVSLTQSITSGNIPKLTISVGKGKTEVKSFYKAEDYITRNLQEQINKRLSEEKQKSDVTDIRAKSLMNPKSRRELLAMLRNTEVAEDQRVLVEDIYSKQYFAKLLDSTKDEYSLAELRSLLGLIQYFMDLKTKATLVNEAVTASKYDTQGARGGFSQARIFEGLYAKLSDPKIPLKGFVERFEGTMAGKYKEMGPELMKHLFGNMFLLGNDVYFGVLQRIAVATKHSRDILENEEFIRNLHRNFRSFIYTETEYFRSIDIKDLLYSTNNISVRLSKAQEEGSSIRNNPFINYLTAEGKSSNEGFPYIISPARVAKSGKEKNILTKGWKDLLYHSDSKVRKLGEDLYKFSIVGSGFKNGFFTFHELVPLEFEIETGVYDQFGRIANDIKENGDINNEYATRFLMTQMHNPDLVFEADNAIIENAYKSIQSSNTFVIGIKETSKYKFEALPLKKEKGEIIAYPEYVPFVSMKEGKDQTRRLYAFKGLDNLGTKEDPNFIPIYSMVDGFNHSGKSRRIYEPVDAKGTSIAQNIKKVPVNEVSETGEIATLRSAFKDSKLEFLRKAVKNFEEKAVKVTLNEIQELNTETFALAPWSNIITNTPTVDEAVNLPTVYKGEMLSPTFRLGYPIIVFIDSSVRKFNSIQDALDGDVTLTDAVQLAAKYNRNIQAEIENMPESLSFIESMDDNYSLPGYGYAVQRAKMLLEAGVIGYQEIKNEQGDTYFINTKEINLYLEELSPEIETREYLKNIKDMINPVIEQSGMEVTTVVSTEARRFLEARNIKGAYLADSVSSEKGVIIMQETLDKKQEAETLLHELLHNITVEGAINDPNLRRKVKVLLDLYIESAQYNSLTPKGFSKVIEDYKSSPTEENENTAFAEFITYGLTNSVVVAQLKKTQVAKEKGTSIFNKLVDIVLDVFGYTKENTNLDVYTLLNETVGEYISQASNLKQGKKFREDAILNILANSKSSTRKAFKVALNAQSNVLKLLSTEINKKCK